MSGYQTLENKDWKRYYLLDSEAKAKNPELIADESKINRGKITNLSSYPVIGSWPLIPQDDLGGIIQEQLTLGRQASLAFQQIPLQH